MTYEEKFNAIIEAVCYWLGYQFKIGRDQLIHEASLRYPIADSITAKGISVNRIVLEQLHPIFKNKKIDLVIFDKSVKEPEAEKDDTNLKEVYEFKLAKNETSKEYKEEHQRVFDDIVRLAYYNLWGSKDCYFLMCGIYEDFKTYFVGHKNKPHQQDDKVILNPKQKQFNQTMATQFEEWHPEGLYKNWFGFKIHEEKEIEFNNADNNNWGLKPFQNNYHIRDAQKHQYTDKFKLKTKCVAISPSGLENIKTHAAGIWRIEAVKE